MSWATTRRFLSSSAEETTPLSQNNHNDNNDDSFFAESTTSFESMGVQSSVLLDRIHNRLGLERPTQIQARSFAAIRGLDQKLTNDDNQDHDDDVENLVDSGDAQPQSARRRDVTIGAETGSGKSYAYLIPLFDSILQEKAAVAAKASSTTDASTPLLPSYDYARAIILVPNKELVHQVVRMAAPLCGGTIRQSLVWGGGGNLIEQLEATSPASHHKEETDPSQLVRMAIMPGGLNDPLDFKPFRDSVGLGGNDAPVDIVVTTPAALGPLALKPKHVGMFADIGTLVIDEADMLLDGGYIRALENVLMGFRRADKLQTDLAVAKTQHIFCAATLPDTGLKSVDAYLQRKFPFATRIQLDNMHNAKHSGLSQPTQWIQLETKRERLDKLVQLLETPSINDGLYGEKVMVFVNSVEDVDGVHQALMQRGIPAVPYHAKVSLQDRAKNLERFRQYQSTSQSLDNKEQENDPSATVPIMVCTDLASRGLDVPGVTAVVQLQFSGNVVSHLHRMGRCGRAGQRTGRGIVFYEEREKDLVDVVREAEAQQERMKLEQDVDDNDSDDAIESGEADAVDAEEIGKVKKAFSRKRGFTKKRKKLMREGLTGIFSSW
ncbi:DEAD/DEAH box helicase domain protein [Nitzschia inconspicua]|uniref:DEAD/DEAH box helicase domain protein n=1 Tax=Nitzschia inconspicua TaxID=303405 RepID=A0A9K3Q5T8_9STRA|nr:DEAD/DEAH box helicase domain protein [Nitzschia inconspicua]